MASSLPSFTRGIFAGEIHDELLFPFPPPLDDIDPDETRTVRRLIDAVEGRLGGLLDSVKFDEEETISDEVIAELARHGFLGLSIPKAYGGLGLSAAAYARVFEAIGGIDSSVSVVLAVHCGLGAKAIVLYGTEAQKAKWLPKLATGEALAAYALTEPLVGSDAQHVKSVATRSPDGKSWILNGEKIWIGLAHKAKVIATFAQTEVERDGKMVMRPTAFLLEPPTPGFHVVGTFRKMGIRGSTQAQLEYKDLHVPAENVLGEVGKGFAVAVNVLNGGRLTLLAGCTGGTKHLLKEMAAYAEQREQFGHTLASYEITQRKFATLTADTYAADAMLAVVADMARRDEADWSLEAAIGKVFASELVWRAADEMVQVAGGRGFVKPHPYERYLRDSRINRIFEGANEILRLFIALNGIQQPSEHLKEVASALREPMKNLGLLSEYAASRVKAVLGTSATLDVTLDKSLEAHKTFLEKHVAELKVATERAITQYKAAIIERQLVVERLSNMAVELFATTCTISRTQAAIEARGVDACAREIAACNLFCVESGRRFREHRIALGGHEDDVDATRREVAQSMREAQGYFADDPMLRGGAVRTEAPSLAGKA